jgi:hypothetical protein
MQAGLHTTPALLTPAAQMPQVAGEQAVAVPMALPQLRDYASLLAQPSSRQIAVLPCASSSGCHLLTLDAQKQQRVR